MMDFPLSRHRRGARVRKAQCPRTPAAFATDDELLNASLQMFAARQALQRNVAGPVTMSDFQAAIRIEQGAEWNGVRGKVIGFIG